MYDPSVGRWLKEDPIGFDAGDMDLYRYVGNNPVNEVDPSGLETPTASRGLPPGGEARPGYYHEHDKKAPIVVNVRAFRAAAAKNKIDPKIVQQILDAALKTPKPIFTYGRPCEVWAGTVDGKMPPRKPSDEVIGVPGVFVSQVAWTYEPRFGNLWTLFVSGHFAIQVKLPDGQVFYFDDGNWGGAFTSKDIPIYAK